MPIDTSYDNRDTCGNISTTTSCVPYTGYVSTLITDLLPCRPNANDVFKNIQILIEDIKTSLGNNKLLDNGCFDYDPLTESQQILNQELLVKVCNLEDRLADLEDNTINPDLINITIDLLCLIDPACTPQSTYTLTEILTKLVTNYCSLLDRIINIESVLNL